MADQEHYDLLKQGVDVWNAWRKKHRDVRPDLSGVDLMNAHLSGVDLSGANLRSADLGTADLSGADLSGANLHGADLYHAFLNGANLRSADLGFANLIHAFLIGADLRQAEFNETLFAWVDLRQVQALETAIHGGPSIVHINSVILPDEEKARLHFLRGVGFTETQIEYLPSLLTPRPIEYQSLFISYASQDEAIARQLYADLRKKDVPCWFAPHDLKPGDYFREEIDRAIHMQEKLLLILSKDSVESRWVKYEVNRALNREIEQDRKILYPIRLDDTVLNSTSGWAADLRADRHIGDFTDWQGDAAYQQAFEKLLRDLKVNKPLIP